MSKFIGFKPNSRTKNATEDFEGKVMIRRNNQRLIATVYADIMEHEWAVALGYNLTRNPGLHGRENVFEVRYSFQPGEESLVTRIGTDTDGEEIYDSRSFRTPDEFVIWALGEEKAAQFRPA